MSHEYDQLFFDYIERGARTSAGRVINVLRGELAIQSVLDVGCGRGTWLAVWLERGVPTIMGIDGEYISSSSLTIPKAMFRATDISRPFSLDRQFDLVQCLEVGEHIPTSQSQQLVLNLVGHAKLVLFSAAPPGQGGEFHINEQPLSYWRRLFRAHDYHPFDFVRPRIADATDVEPWYRFNTILYVRKDAIPTLPSAIARTGINEQVDIPELAPVLWRVRRRVLRYLPVKTTTRLAVLKHKLVVARSRLFASHAR